MKLPLRILLASACLVAVGAAESHAQVVNVRTAPVSVAEQFYTFPSERMGMGGSIALEDLEADPFANPAAGARLDGTRITASPTMYRLPEDDGFGRSLPLTLFASGGPSFLVFSIAPQELESAQRARFFDPAPTVKRSDRFSQNLYTFGLVGHRFGNSAVAVSGSYAKLDALHMVDLLYPDAERIEQGGRVTDLRVGYLREMREGRSLEAVVVRHTVDMEHTVTYVDRVWFEPAPGHIGGFVAAPPREEFNEDNTTTWGAHLAYKRPMPETKWRLAGALTANAKSHPHIPNYDFMRIPRDPGNSWAFRLALGAAHTDNGRTIALDLSYEPAWTSTWAEAATELESVSGKTIPIGAVTVENEMVFSNTNVHVGWEKELDRTLAVQLGLGVRRVNYWLDQYSHVLEVDRAQDEGWTEVTPSWGLKLSFAEFNLRYFGHRRGGVAGFETTVAAEGPGDVDIVAAPSAPLNMDVVPVWIHQLGVSVPLGGRR